MNSAKPPEEVSLNVEEQFSQFVVSKEEVYFQPIHGNHGDELIVMGIEQLAAQTGLSFSSELQKAQHLLIKGGGALLDIYPSLLEQFKTFLSEHSSVPTTILPTSYLLHSTSMSELVGQRTAPLHIYAREQISYDLLKKQSFFGPVSISRDHDTAFHLEASAYISQLKKISPKHILIVERIDREALGNKRQLHGAAPKSTALKKLARTMIPAKLRAQIHQLLGRSASDAGKSPFAVSALERIYDEHPEFQHLPVKALDVSSSTCCEKMEDFSEIIASSAVVFSTRLHVGILSALLDIPTYLVEGVYHKISGIYDYTMREMEHVQLIRNNSSSVTQPRSNEPKIES